MPGGGSGGAPISLGTSVTQANALTTALAGLGLTIKNLQLGFDAVVRKGTFYDQTQVLASSDPFLNGIYVALNFTDVSTLPAQKPLALWIRAAGGGSKVSRSNGFCGGKS